MNKLIYDNDQPQSSFRLQSHRRKSFQRIFGTRVANILLWRNKQLSAAILAGVTLIYFLLEVVEYNFLSLVCHLTISMLLAVFIWSNVAPLFNREPPKIPEIVLSERAFRHAAVSFYARFTRCMFFLHYIASGKDLKMLLLVILLLWIVSAIGSYCSTLTLLYLVFLCLHTLPVLYEHYEGEVNRLATRGRRDLKKLFKKLDSKVLNKIPRAPIKDKRHR